VGLSPGTRLGPYEIIGTLGAGGMGEVYRARDTALNRHVAIKFISAELAGTAARQRFQREAELLSSLNHPHVLAVYGLGELEDTPYLVTELVDGGTLDDWVRAHEPSWRQVVGLLTSVAEGLAAAHDAGILHRDLKPANILIGRSGYPKLADFGLAKSMGSQHEGTTVVSPTHAGLIVGTIAYMSPEQAAGRAVDARSDIFSFGVVLYEALTRKHPFGGISSLEVLQAVMHRQPERLPDEFPFALRLLVEKALEKDPAERYQSTRDLVVDLRRLSRDRPPAASSAERPRAHRPAAWLAGAALAGAAAAIAVMSFAIPPASEEPNPLANASFTRLTNFDGTERSAVVSPDGRFVAFRADREGPLDVWLAQVGTGRFTNLTKGIDDEFATDTPSCGFSFDGSEIWLSGGPDRRLRLLPIIGGNPRPFLTDRAVTVAWSPDGQRIVYHLQDDGDSMYVADRTGANARLLFRRTQNEHNHFPVWSTDGRWIYFSSGTPITKEMDVWRIAVEGGTPERLTTHDSDVGYLAPIDAHTLLYVTHDQDGSGPWLWALNVDRKTTRRVSFGIEKYTSVAATPDGSRVVATVSNPSAHLWTVPITPSGAAQEADVKPFALPTAEASAPRIGGGALFYLSSLGAGDGVWRFAAGEVSEIWKGSDGSVLTPPAASSDGKQVAVVIRRDGRLRLHVLSADGGEIRTLADGIDVRGGASWSPDNTWIAVGGNESGTPGLFKIPVGGGAPMRLTAGPAFNPAWSPDGQLIVYGGPNVSAFQVLLAVRPDGTPVELPRILIRRDGERVRFMPDGKAVLFMQGTLRAQDFAMLDLATMSVRTLTHLSQRDTMRTFDVMPDGKRLVFDRLRDNSDIVVIDLRKPTR
jgi:Tol biopolymer transport system component